MFCLEEWAEGLWPQIEKIHRSCRSNRCIASLTKRLSNTRCKLQSYKAQTKSVLHCSPSPPLPGKRNRGQMSRRVLEIMLQRRAFGLGDSGYGRTMCRKRWRPPLVHENAEIRFKTPAHTSVLSAPVSSDNALNGDATAAKMGL